MDEYVYSSKPWVECVGLRQSPQQNSDEEHLHNTHLSRFLPTSNPNPHFILRFHTEILLKKTSSHFPLSGSCCGVPGNVSSSNPKILYMPSSPSPMKPDIRGDLLPPQFLVQYFISHIVLLPQANKLLVFSTQYSHMGYSWDSVPMTSLLPIYPAPTDLRFYLLDKQTAWHQWYENQTVEPPLPPLRA